MTYYEQYIQMINLSSSMITYTTNVINFELPSKHRSTS